MNTIIIHPLPRFHCPFDDAFRVIEEVMLRPTWFAKPVPWWIHDGLGVMGMAKIVEEVEEEEVEADSDITPSGEVDLDAEKSLLEWLRQEMEEEEECVLVGHTDEDDDWSIYSQDSFVYDLCEVDGPGIPPSMPLPPLPSLLAVSAAVSVIEQVTEPRRLTGEALENVVNFMDRAVSIGKERRRKKRQVFEDEC